MEFQLSEPYPLPTRKCRLKHYVCRWFVGDGLALCRSADVVGVITIVLVIIDLVIEGRGIQVDSACASLNLWEPQPCPCHLRGVNMSIKPYQLNAMNELHAGNMNILKNPLILLPPNFLACGCRSRNSNPKVSWW